MAHITLKNAEKIRRTASLFRFNLIWATRIVSHINACILGVVMAFIGLATCLPVAHHHHGLALGNARARDWS
jgi:uncharacterized membrane protein